MKFIHTAHIAAKDLWGHVFRSALTALGVIFGVGAVVAMMAISEGARRESLAQIEALGIDNIVVRSIRPESGKSVSQGRSWSALEFGIKRKDIEHIAKLFDNIDIVVPVRDARKSIYVGGIKTDVHVMATTPAFMELTRSVNADPRGRFLAYIDGEDAHPACVLGTRAARKLFSFHDPLGRNLSIGGTSFRVVGLIRSPNELKLADGMFLNNMVYIHLRTATVIFGKTSRQESAGSRETTRIEADYLYVRVKDQNQIENTAARLRTYMSTTHTQQDWEVQVPYELLKQREAQQRIFTIVMASIAAISLLVGGIGIMNIMMANVYERIKEIGTRRALGARKSDILLQFLSEAVMLTVIGGAVGVGLGAGLAAAVTWFSTMPTNVTMISIVVSLIVSIMVGVVFGTYPAWKAANLDPITALRTE